MLHGDCREILPTLETESVDIVVTGLPFWGPKRYGFKGAIGGEQSLDG
jgi:DNA modification methylase